MTQQAAGSSPSRFYQNKVGERICHVTSTKVRTFRFGAEMGNSQGIRQIKTSSIVFPKQKAIHKSSEIIMFQTGICKDISARISPLCSWGTIGEEIWKIKLDCQIKFKSWTCTLYPKFKMTDDTGKPESLIFLFTILPSVQ